MFTRCPTICPKVSRKMKSIGEDCDKAGLPLRLVSLSVDGEHDSPPVLRAYARKHGLSIPPHVLLTGDSTAVAKHAEEHFKIAVEGSFDEATEHLGITHGSHLVLVDSRGNIRGYYPSSSEDTNERILTDLKAL
jgi:protein SCO1/2